MAQRAGAVAAADRACALALTIGLGQAYADSPTSAHEGGQGADKSGSAFASAEAFAGDGTARASSVGRAEAFGAAEYETAAAKRKAEEAKVTVTVDIEEEGIGTSAWTRTVTRTMVNRRFVSSVTRSQSYATDEEGNLAIAKAWPRRARPTTSPPCAMAPAASPPRPASTSPATVSPAPMPAAPSASPAAVSRSKPGAAPAPRCSRQDLSTSSHYPSRRNGRRNSPTPRANAGTVSGRGDFFAGKRSERRRPAPHSSAPALSGSSHKSTCGCTGSAQGRRRRWPTSFAAAAKAGPSPRHLAIFLQSVYLPRSFQRRLAGRSAWVACLRRIVPAPPYIRQLDAQAGSAPPAPTNP